MATESEPTEENWLAPFGAATFFSAVTGVALYMGMKQVAITSMGFVLVVALTRMILEAQKREVF